MELFDVSMVCKRCRSDVQSAEAWNNHSLDNVLYNYTMDDVGQCK